LRGGGISGTINSGRVQPSFGLSARWGCHSADVAGWRRGKAERTARKVYCNRDEARSHGFDYIERFYNPRRRQSKLAYLSPLKFEAGAGSYGGASAAPASAVVRVLRLDARWWSGQGWW